MILRCTVKVLQLVSDGRSPLAGATAAGSDNDWYANLLWFDRRKCLLITHAGTLFSVFGADVRKADVLPVGRFVVPLIERELRSEGLPSTAFGMLDPDDVHLAKTTNRTVLGCMNDMAIQCQCFIADEGGLAATDINALNHYLRRTMNSPRGYARPVDLAARWLGVGRSG